MEQLILKNFLGKNLKASPFDIEHHQSQTIDGFEISKVIGSLVRSFGYKMATNLLGNQYTNFLKLNGMDSGAFIGRIGTWRYNNTNLYLAYDKTHDRVYFWNNSIGGWEQLDYSTSYNYDDPLFFTRQDALIVSAGIGATNYPVFIKYYNARKVFGSSTNNQSADYYNYKLNDLSFGGFVGFASNSYAYPGDLKSGFYIYYACAVYDGVQNGSISEMILPTKITTSKSIQLTIAGYPTQLPRRVTHIKIFRAYAEKEFGDPWQSAYHLVTIPVENNVDELPVILSGKGTYDEETLTVDGLGNYTVSDDVFIGFYLALWKSGESKIYKKITDNDTTKFTIENGSGLEDGRDYYWEVISYWIYSSGIGTLKFLDYVFDLTSLLTDNLNRTTKEVNKYNFKYLVVHNGRAFYAPIYDVAKGEILDSVIGVSNINGDGNSEYDVITNFINVKDFGVSQITGMGKILDFIIIFTYENILKLNIATGNMLSWELVESLEHSGCIAPNSLTYIWSNEFKFNGYFYRSADGYRVFDGYKSQLISMPIEEAGYQPFHVTDPTEAVGSYNPQTKQWIISYPTDRIIHIFDLISGEWLERSFPDKIYSFCVDRNSILLGTNGSKIFAFTNDGTSDLTDYDGTKINPIWKSKVYNCDLPGVTKIAKYISLVYRSDTPIQLRWYLNRSSSPKSPNSLTAFPSQSTLQTRLIGMPLSQRFDEIEFEIGLSETYKSSNTVLQIDELRLLFDVEKLRK